MNVACDYEAPMQMLTTEKYIAARTTIPKWKLNVLSLPQRNLKTGTYGVLRYSRKNAAGTRKQSQD